MKWLKDLIGEYVAEDKIDEVVEKYNKAAPLHTMPKDKFNEVNEEFKLTKKQLSEQSEAVKTLQKKAETVEEYEKKVADLTEKYQQLEAESQKEIAQITKKSSFKEALIGAGATKSAVDLLVKATDLEDKEVNDDLIKSIMDESPDLFITQTEESKAKDDNKQPPAEDPMARFRRAAGLPT